MGVASRAGLGWAPVLPGSDRQGQAKVGQALDMCSAVGHAKAISAANRVELVVREQIEVMLGKNPIANHEFDTALLELVIK